MNRRRYLATVGGSGILFGSGCLDDPGVEGGVLEVFGVDAPPEATVIEASDDRIRNVEPIQDGVRRADRESGRGAVKIEVAANEYDEVAQTLADLPWYDRIEHDSSYVSGVYIRDEDAVYVVVLTPYCTDSWLRDARSERGEYGWGGCIERAE